MDFYNGFKNRNTMQIWLKKRARRKQPNSSHPTGIHITSIYNPPLLHPYATLPLPIWGSLLAAAASCATPPVAWGRQVLVDGAAVRNETQAQLEVSSQTAEGSQCQDQQRGEQQKAHNQQSHTAGVIQQVWTVQRCSVGLHCGVAEEAKYDHGKSRGEDGAEDDAGQPEVDQCYDHILCSDQHRTCPAVQRAP